MKQQMLILLVLCWGVDRIPDLRFLFDATPDLLITPILNSATPTKNHSYIPCVNVS
jgi:hypothetical protein